MKLSIRQAFSIVLTISFTFATQTSFSVSAQTYNDIAATVDGKNITQKDIDESISSQILPLQQQIYILRKAALENLSIRIILESEAKKQGITVDELRRRLTTGKFEVSAIEVEKVYLENATAFAAMSSDEAKERIRLDLESQARMRNYRQELLKLRKKAVIKVLLSEPVVPALDLQSAPSIGKKEAPVTVIEFSDYQCPYCKEAQNAVRQIQQKYGTNVRFVFKHFPLEVRSQAFSAAQAAYCANEQNQFWNYHDALFASDSLSPTVLKELAAKFGLNTSKFAACLQSENSRLSILKDIQDAQQLGINGTPAFIINGKLTRGVLSFEDFDGIIEREINSAQTITQER